MMGEPVESGEWLSRDVVMAAVESALSPTSAPTNDHIGPVLDDTGNAAPHNPGIDRILIHGGEGMRQGERENMLEVYYPSSDLPSDIYQLEKSRLHHSATRFHDGSILIAGGWSWTEVTKQCFRKRGVPSYSYTAVARCEKLDPVSLQVTPAAYMPNATVGHSAASLNQSIYLSGGIEGHWGTVFRYRENRWLQVANRLTERSLNSEFYLSSDGQSLFAFHGIESYTRRDGTVEVSNCERYDEERNEWNKIAGMPVSPMPCRAVYGRDSRFWVVGGKKQICQIFDTRSGQWSTGPRLNRARTGHGLVTTANGQIWALGGWNDRSVEVLDPRNPVWQSWEKPLELPCHNGAVIAL